MGWTKELLEAVYRKRGQAALVVLPEKPKKKRRGVMNKAETAYAEHLQLRLIVGEITQWAFELMPFELTPDAKFTPDFDLREADGRRMLVDVKDYWKNQKRVHVEEPAMLRIKFAAEKYPEHRWAQAWRDERGEWQHRYFGVKR